MGRRRANAGDGERGWRTSVAWSDEMRSPTDVRTAWYGANEIIKRVGRGERDESASEINVENETSVNDECTRARNGLHGWIGPGDTCPGAALHAGRSFVFNVPGKFFRFHLPFEYTAVGHTPSLVHTRTDTTTVRPPAVSSAFRTNLLRSLPLQPIPGRGADFIYPRVLFLSTGLSSSFTP